MNNKHVQHVIQELLKRGVREVCICPGSRNAPLLYAVTHASEIKTYFWFEERAAAFFALGRIKATHHPVAVISTSGTAVAEMLPAAMEAYYTRMPLILVTADRPRSYRGTNAPQTAEQVGIFGCYAPFSQDLAFPESCALNDWCGRVPVHLNVCIEEPYDVECKEMSPDETKPGIFTQAALKTKEDPFQPFHEFAKSVKNPLVIVGALHRTYRSQAVDFLLKLGWPLYTEGLSGLREEPKLDPLRIIRADQIWKKAEACGYPIDGVLRIGGIPTIRLWRDLEDRQDKVRVCSITEQPFSGLSGQEALHVHLDHFFEQVIQDDNLKKPHAAKWIEANAHFQKELINLFEEEPRAEQSLVHQLSKRIASGSNVYLGNSMPIRYWDLAAIREDKDFHMAANRGLSGIDGQMSTFFGYCSSTKENWALLGDLTALYDMAAPWILEQLPEIQAQICIINNSGGQIFSRMYSHPKIINSHDVRFEHLAKMWRLGYSSIETIPDKIETHQSHIIEIVPDNEATKRFWKKMEAL